MLSIFDLLHELICKVGPKVPCVVPSNIPAFAQIAWLEVNCHHMGLFCASSLSFLYISDSFNGRPPVISRASFRQGYLASGVVGDTYLEVT